MIANALREFVICFFNGQLLPCHYLCRKSCFLVNFYYVSLMYICVIH